MAYNRKHIKVKAHSTRGIGMSWALFNEASLKSALDSAADWSKESTFTRFYLRDVNQTGNTFTPSRTISFLLTLYFSVLRH